MKNHSLRDKDMQEGEMLLIGWYYIKQGKNSWTTSPNAHAPHHTIVEWADTHGPTNEAQITGRNPTCRPKEELSWQWSNKKSDLFTKSI